MINLDKLKRGHQRFMAELSRELDQVLDDDKLTGLAQRYVSQHGGFKSRTGKLVEKTKAKVIRSGNRRLIRITNSAPYAAAQDGGSGLYGPKHAKYRIPKNGGGKTLKFLSGGQFVFRRVVMHPGVHPTRFLYNANDAAYRVARGWLLAAMRRAAQRF